jgi:cytochrome c553
MWGLSHNLSDAQIGGLAEYFAKQLPSANAAVDPALMSIGKDIYENGVPSKEAPPCMACHGPKGEGVANFPRLASQHQDYMIKQLQVFQRTEQRPNTPMKQVTHLLSREDMEAVAGYLQGFALTQQQ